MARSRLTNVLTHWRRILGPILGRYLALLKKAKNFADAKIVLQAALDRDPQNSALKGELIRVEADIGGLEGALIRRR
jgi:hypothetical protein